MKTHVMKEILSENVVNIVHGHDLEMHHPVEDLHSSQVSKAIVEEYLNLRLFRYGKNVTANTKMSDFGVRKKLTLPLQSVVPGKVQVAPKSMRN